MKLVAEQIKYLRERRAALEQKRDEYNEYFISRDRTGYDRIGMPQYGDVLSDMEYGKTFAELKEIDATLLSSTYETQRNFDVIDIGTLFRIRFADDETEEILLVEKGIAHDGTKMASLESDLGTAVYGHKEGDEVSYRVKATGRTMSVHIDEIVKLRSSYEHFLREKNQTDRMSDRVKKDLRDLKINNPKEYRRRHMITRSQEILAREELERTKGLQTPSAITRRTFLNKVLNSDNITLPPTDDSIGIGSKVEVLLQDEFGNVEERSFELINTAISTELESHYVERISPLGNEIFGLCENDTFTVIRKNKPRLKGIVKSVDNANLKERVK